jgi:hypothetical protein
MSIPARTTTLVAVAVLAAGCGQPEGRQAPADTETAGSVVAEAPGALATRREAQESFDRAREALIRNDDRASVTYLTQAATFIRAHAAQAEVGAIAALQGAAKELEVLAERLARGEPVTTRTFDRVVANANRAEAQHHLTRAVAALTDREHRRAGEELIIAVDHLERAAQDLHRPNDPDAAGALADARTLAERMVGGAVPARAETRRVTRELEAELRRLCAIVDAEARACAVEAAR